MAASQKDKFGIREMRKSFVPGKRRPWALNKLCILVKGEERVMGLDLSTHGAIIEAQYASFQKGDLQVEQKKGDYTFKGGLWDGVRLFSQNNQPPHSLSDFHAEQILALSRTLSGTKIKNYAIVGIGHSADQLLNVLYLMNPSRIHVFEADPEKIAGAKYTFEKLGLGELVGPDKKIQFHDGDAAQTMPKIAEKVGGFDAIDLQLVLQHLRGEAFGQFLTITAASLRKGGLLKINELMLGQFGVDSTDENAGSQELKAKLERYLVGDGTLKTPSFLNVGWRWPGGHAWNSKEEFIADIQANVGEILVLRPDLEMSLDQQKVGANHSFLMGMRYLCPTLAAAMTARARALKEAGAKEAGQFEALAKWAWEEGEKFDDSLTSEEFKKGAVTIRFSGFAGVVFQKS